MELAEQRRCPVRAEHLIGIIEESGRQGCTGGLEGSVEARQVMGHGSRVEVVYDVPLAARSRPFHLLPRAAFVEGDDSALAFHLALIVLLHYQAGVWLFFLWSRQDDAFGLVAVNKRINHHQLACSFGERRLGRTERPACPEVHVYLYALPLALADGKVQHLHPLGRKEGDIIGIVALHAIERRYLQSPDAVGRHLLHLPTQSRLRDGRTQPPPSCACLRGMLLYQLVVLHGGQQHATRSVVLEVGNLGVGHGLPVLRLLACALYVSDEAVRVYCISGNGIPGLVCGRTIFLSRQQFVPYAPCHSHQEEGCARRLGAAVGDGRHQTDVPETILALTLQQGFHHGLVVRFQLFAESANLLILAVARGLLYVLDGPDVCRHHPSVAAAPIAILPVALLVGRHEVGIAPPQPFLFIPQPATADVARPLVAVAGKENVAHIARDTVHL